MVFIFTLSLINPALSQTPPPVIQPGTKFIYKMYDAKTGEPENIFHKYIIESVTPQSITVLVESDIVGKVRVNVRPNGEIEPGNRFDLWLPLDIQQGARFKMAGIDATVLKKGASLGPEEVTAILVVSTDQSMGWIFFENVPQKAQQYKGLLLTIIFNQKNKFLKLENIEQAGEVTTTSTYSTTIVTVVDTRGETRTVTETVTTATVRTVTVSTTQTVTERPQVESQSFFPLPLAIGLAVGIVGGVFFLTRTRRKPLPPTYPYPPYATSPPAYPQQPVQYQQIVGACPACRFPIYRGDFACRRCGYRF